MKFNYYDAILVHINNTRAPARVSGFCNTFKKKKSLQIIEYFSKRSNSSLRPLEKVC